jgi:hypothetical protein
MNQLNKAVFLFVEVDFPGDSGGRHRHMPECKFSV